jgi:hypothetical protein
MNKVRSYSAPDFHHELNIINTSHFNTIISSPSKVQPLHFTQHILSTHKLKKNKLIIKQHSNEHEHLRTKRHKVKDIDFYILSFHEYNQIYERNYSVRHLKQICAYYKQKINGNKHELEKRVFEFLKQSHHIIRIQRVWHRHLLHRMKKARGPAYNDRKKCINEMDFYTMDNVNDIHPRQFFSFQENEGSIYGFDIISLYNMMIRTKKGQDCINPYNRNPIQSSILDNVKLILRLSKLIGSTIQTELEKTEDVIELTPQRRMELKTIDLFQQMNELGNYTNHTWFTSLRKPHLLRFMRELMDIWNYRAQLTREIQREICHPQGLILPILNLAEINNQPEDAIRNFALQWIEHLITKGINQSSKSLGANFVLCALTLVNQNAAEALPWLYQSVL